MWFCHSSVKLIYFLVILAWNRYLSEIIVGIKVSWLLKICLNFIKMLGILQYFNSTVSRFVLSFRRSCPKAISGELWLMFVIFRRGKGEIFQISKGHFVLILLKWLKIFRAHLWTGRGVWILNGMALYWPMCTFHNTHYTMFNFTLWCLVLSLENVTIKDRISSLN